MISSSLCAGLDFFRISSPVILDLKSVSRGSFHVKLGRRWKVVSSHLNGTTMFERQHLPLVTTSRQNNYGLGTYFSGMQDTRKLNQTVFVGLTVFGFTLLSESKNS